VFGTESRRFYSADPKPESRRKLKPENKNRKTPVKPAFEAENGTKSGASWGSWQKVIPPYRVSIGAS
jgi:hypothetical protein